MPTATIQVQDKWLPEGRKRWVLKNSDGVLYGANADIAGGFSKGNTYQVNYKIDRWKGKDYNVIEEIIGSGGSTPAPRPQAQSIPAPNSSGDSFKDEQIASLAIIKTKSGEAGDRVASLHALKQAALAWRDFKKWQKEGNIESGKRRSSEEEFNDDIPY